MCPRLLINREKAGTVDPMMAMLQGMFGSAGLALDSPNNIRDVALLGDCDEGCVKMAEFLGWKVCKQIKPFNSSSFYTPVIDIHISITRCLWTWHIAVRSVNTSLTTRKLWVPFIFYFLKTKPNFSLFTGWHASLISNYKEIKVKNITMCHRIVQELHVSKRNFTVKLYSHLKLLIKSWRIVEEGYISWLNLHVIYIFRQPFCMGIIQGILIVWYLLYPQKSKVMVLTVERVWLLGWSL